MDKNRLSPWEARRNLGEMVEKIGPVHAREVENKISDALYAELFLNFGETLDHSLDFCNFCENYDCDCTWID